VHNPIFRESQKIIHAGLYTNKQFFYEVLK
jgi:hypothetical protein